jgi:FAD/FMN-containing dehydrogenase/Fe-S oxidoreductase
MDPQRERIYDDLRGLVAGDVRCDDLTLALYASDASLYEIRPLCVVCPRSLDDVVACTRYAAENRLPIHARGAGSGLAGGCVGPGLVLDFSRYLRRTLAVRDDSVVVQPGVVLGALNADLRRRGRVFGPDPANATVTTMGSVAALDAAGSHFPRYGSARNYIRRIQAVLADGSVIEAGREPLVADEASPATRPKRDLVAQVADLVLHSRSLISARQPAGSARNGGYRLADVLSESRLDLARLLVGSQGTLALFTELEFATVPLPEHVGVVLLLFDRLERAAHAAREVATLGISACDLIDRRHLGLAREADVRYDLLIPSIVEAALVVECQADSADELREKLTQVTFRTCRDERLAIDARQTVDPHEMDLYWQLATHVVPRLHRLGGASRPLPFVEDITVSPAALPEFLVRLQNVLKQHQVTASLYGHVGHGRLHVRPFLDLNDPADVGRMSSLADDLYGAVLDVGGGIGGELGDGLSRTAFLRRQYGPLADVFAELKRLFDPLNILNPGKVVADDREQMTRHFRPAALSPGGPATNGRPASAESAVVPLHLLWNNDEMLQAARQCNGCGACRTQLLPERMCPIFRYAPREEASPRAKANLVRAVLTGQLDAALLPSDEMKAIADLCVHCHQCRLECPAGVDIPKLMVETRAAHVAHAGLSPSDWLMTRLDLAGRYAAAVRPLANWALGNRQMRWLLEKLFGIAAGRKLPRVAGRSFIRQAIRRRWHLPSNGASINGRKALYFVDVYANHFDPELGAALAAVLAHHDIEMYVPPEQEQAGMALFALGAVDRARALAQKNVRRLAEPARQGYTILATEPSAVLCLTHEYLQLLDDDDARLVANCTMEACTFLWKLHQQGELRLDFRPIAATVGYHQPCHLRALAVGSPGENLLRLVPGLTVVNQNAGCSGMAGTFGMKREHYRSSLRAGWGLITRMRDPALTIGATECSTCKMQMEQGTTTPTIHPIKLLALAYGLMPQLERLLTTPGRELVVT